MEYHLFQKKNTTSRFKFDEICKVQTLHVDPSNLSLQLLEYYESLSSYPKEKKIQRL